MNIRFYISLFKFSSKDKITSAAVEFIKTPNNNCVVALDMEKYSRQLSFQQLLTEQSSIQYCNISANGFSSIWI